MKEARKPRSEGTTGWWGKRGHARIRGGALTKG